MSVYTYVIIMNIFYYMYPTQDKSRWRVVVRHRKVPAKTASMKTTICTNRLLKLSKVAVDLLYFHMIFTHRYFTNCRFHMKLQTTLFVSVLFHFRYVCWIV